MEGGRECRCREGRTLMEDETSCTVYQARRKDQIRKKKILTDHLRRTALTTNTNAKQEGSIV